MSEGREILERVRRRQYGGSDPLDIADALTALGPAPGPDIAEEQVLERFLTRLKINKVEVAATSSRSDAVKHIGRFIYGEHHSHRVVAGNDRRLAALPWRDGGVLVRFGAATPEDPVSISYAHAGVAETGSLLLYCNRDNPAANNWLTRDHIVILDIKDLCGQLEDAWARIRQDTGHDRVPRGVALISGPSSTGDIIGHLVTGAHGPQRLHLLIIGLIPDDVLARTGHGITP